VEFVFMVSFLWWSVVSMSRLALAGAVSECGAVGEVFILVLGVSVCYCEGFSFLGKVYLEGLMMVLYGA
jgi:hypothetical protein